MIPHFEIFSSLFQTHMSDGKQLFLLILHPSFWYNLSVLVKQLLTITEVQVGLTWTKLLLSSGGSKVTAQSEPALRNAATLLGVEPDEMKQALVSRVMQASRGGVKGTAIM